MSRIRTIKPEFWQHEELSMLPEATHILAAVLLNYADDEGYFNANPKLIKASCLPLREDSVSTHDSLNSLVKIGFIRVGTASDGKKYGHLVNFLEHQRINRATPSKIKRLDINWDNSLITHTPLSEVLPLEGKGRERKGKEKKKKQEKRKKEINPILKTQANEVLNFLNAKTGRTYRAVDTNLGFIIARLESGATVEDCRAIIAKKYREWKDDSKMDLYLRPATLFNKTKFEQYLGELLPEEKHHD